MKKGDDQTKAQNHLLQKSSVDNPERVHNIVGESDCEDHIEELGAVDARESSYHVVKQALVEDHDVNKFIVRQDTDDG